MKIYIDADALPKPVRNIVFKASSRLKIEVILVAAGYINITNSQFIKVINVPQGEDSADDKIVQLVEKDDLVITQDIPLASRVIDKEAFALNPRGTFYDKESIKERLSMRNFMENLRDQGINTKGPKSYDMKNKQKFAAAFDKFLAQHIK